MSAILLRIITEKNRIRSKKAYNSQKSLKWINVIASKPEEALLKKYDYDECFLLKKIGCIQSHIFCLNYLTESQSEIGVVIEDDAILSKDIDWISYTNFDLFFPYRYNRKYLSEDKSIKIYSGNMKRIYNGTFAYLINKRTAKIYIKICNFIFNLLREGFMSEIERSIILYAFSADAVFSLILLLNKYHNLNIGEYQGNLVNHDNETPSFINKNIKTIANSSKEEIDKYCILGKIEDGLDPIIYYPIEGLEYFDKFYNILLKYKIEELTV